MNSADRRRAWLVGALVFLALLPGAFFGLPGKSVAGAWRVLDGDVPYRDFWTMYAPGQFYAVAALLALGGKQVLAPAIAAVALRALTASTWFSVARGFGASRAVATSVAVALGLATFELTPELSSYPPAIALIAWALLELGEYGRGDGARHLHRAGAALGVAAVFKHDVAAYASVACAFAIVVASVRRPVGWLGWPHALARLLWPAAAIVVIVAGWLALVAGRSAFDDLLAFPLGDFRAVRGEPYPSWSPNLAPLRAWLADTSQLAQARDAVDALATWICGHAPEAAFALAAVFVARRSRQLEPARLLVALALLAFLAACWWAAHTQQNTHLTSMACAAFLLGAWMWSERAFRPALAVLGVVYTAGLALTPLAQLYLPLRVWSEPVALSLPHTRGILVSPRERDVYRSIDQFVRANVPVGEPIHCGVARHDAIVINNPRFHYVVDRRPATRYHELHPGITDRADVQSEMLADLERQRVRCIVLWRFAWPDAMLDEIVAKRVKAIPECGAVLLDEYFAREFEPVLERGEYVVLWRRGEPSPKTR